MAKPRSAKRSLDPITRTLKILLAAVEGTERLAHKPSEHLGPLLDALETLASSSATEAARRAASRTVVDLHMKPRLRSPAVVRAWKHESREIGYFIIGPQDLSAEAALAQQGKSSEYQQGSTVGWANKTKSKKRNAFLIGGLLGTAAWVVALLQIRARLQQDCGFLGQEFVCF